MQEVTKFGLRRLQGKSLPSPHPDANLIGAFVENSLTREVRGQLTAHLAQCSECREIVFLAMPDMAAVQVFAPQRSSWLSWPVLRWSAAVAAVVVVAAAVSLYRQDHPSGPSLQSSDVPLAGRDYAPQPQATPQIAAPVNPVSAPADRKTAALDSASHQPADALKKQAKPALPENLLADRGSPASSLTRRASPQAASPPAANERDENIPGRAKDAQEPVTNAEAGAVAVTAAAPDSVKAHAALMVPIAPPRWTLTSDGVLQVSLDFGRSWRPALLPDQGTFHALAVNGANDIWVGGEKGVLYHSADAGRRWVQVVPSFAGQLLEEDIIGIRFLNPMHGTLTTPTQETWVTEDGGVNWTGP